MAGVLGSLHRAMMQQLLNLQQLQTAQAAPRIRQVGRQAILVQKPMGRRVKPVHFDVEFRSGH